MGRPRVGAGAGPPGRSGLGPKGHPALKNRLVRRALAFGIDRAALLNHLSFGRFTRPLQNGILLTNSSFYERHWHVYRYRPVESRRLLEQAGCSRSSDGIYSCAGQRLSLRLAARGFGARGASEVEEAGVRSLQAQLKGVGIEVVPVFSPSSRELVRSRRIVDQKARMRLLNSVDALLARDVPFIPLYQQPWFVSHTPRLRGVVNNPWEGFTWTSERWWLER